MATYAELLSASINPGLRDKIRVAVVIAAEVARTELATTTNHVNRLLWSKAAYANPEREAERMIWAVLAQNQAVTLANILAATDAAVQTAVSAAIDVFANGS
jgi:hypothetical protein